MALETAAWMGIGLLVAVVMGSASLAHAQSWRLHVCDVTTRDAPAVEQLQQLAVPRQNIAFGLQTLGPGSAGGTALYMTAHKPRVPQSGPVGATPVLLVLDLQNGKLHTYFDQVRTQGGRALPRTGPTRLADVWTWGTVLGGASQASSFFIIAQGSARPEDAPVLVRFDPVAGSFEQIATLPAQPVGIFSDQNRLHVVLADGRVMAHDALFGGMTLVCRLPGNFSPMGRIVTAGDGVHYAVMSDGRGSATSGVSLCDVVGFSLPQQRRWQVRFPEPFSLERGDLLVDAAGHVLLNAIGQRPQGAFAKTYRIDGEVAHERAEPSVMVLRDDASEIQVQLQLDHNPPSVLVTQADGTDTQWAIDVPDFERDSIKRIYASADGRHVYTFGWPVAWVGVYDLETHIYRTLGRHYNIYDIRPWRGELWMTAYALQKLLRWDPHEPWTLDESRDVLGAVSAGNASAWGIAGNSNPRLVCSFRNFKQMRARRTSGLVIDRLNTAWVGSRTPAVNYIEVQAGPTQGVRNAGAVNWYDADNEMIGSIRDAFRHQSVMDLASAGPDHVLAVTSFYPTPYEPLPPDPPGGGIFLIDIQTRQVVDSLAPTGAAYSYAVEARPGIVVIFSRASRQISDQPHRGIFVVYDVARRQVTDMVVTQVAIGRGEYSVLPFVKGPDGKIYFYAQDQEGAALCRFNLDTMSVEPVLRSDKIMGLGSAAGTHAWLSFGREDVFFAGTGLWRLPLQTVLGPAQ